MRASTVAVVLRQLAAPPHTIAIRPAELCRPTDANRESANVHDIGTSKVSLVCEDAAVVLVRSRDGRCNCV